MRRTELEIFIGFDGREAEAYHVCVKSILKNTTIPVRIHTLDERVLRAQGLFWRPQRKHGPGHGVDLMDGKPFSTEFSFTRFLLPWLKDSGWAIFVDLDFMFRCDIAELYGLRDSERALMCVHHDYRPPETIKMDGVAQERYNRKNWSSLMMWNLSHDANKSLSLADVNEKPGAWLHQLQWLPDEVIGELPVEWNWLAEYSDESIDPKAVHYTLGGPWMPQYAKSPYADEWRDINLGE